jgi:hypothetical protein
MPETYTLDVEPKAELSNGSITLVMLAATQLSDTSIVEMSTFGLLR